MKKRDVRNIYDVIHLDLTDYGLKDRLLVRVPTGDVLCGVLFDSSAFSKEAFYIHIFVQPLYVPAEYLVLTFGERVPGVWEHKASNVDILAPRVLKAIQDQARPFHERFSTAESFYRNAERTFPTENIHLQQALVLTAIYLGRKRDAQRHFDALRLLIEKSDPKIPWPRAVLAETETFVSEATADPNAAHRHLREVRLSTLKNLRLDDLPKLT